jgi:hypothetical protein
MCRPGRWRTIQNSSTVSKISEIEITPSLFDIAQGSPRRVTNMQNIDCVIAHSVENPEWVANDCNDADIGALGDARSRFRCAANAVDDIDQAAFDRLGYRGAGAG